MSRLWSAALLDLESQVDALFEELVYRPWAAVGARGWRPALDVHETTEAYVVDIDLPGIPPQEVRVAVRDRTLTVSGDRRPLPPVEGVPRRIERPCGPFQRPLTLPQPVDPRRARAEWFPGGTVRVVLPKQRQPPGGSGEVSGPAILQIIQSVSAEEVRHG